MALSPVPLANGVGHLAAAVSFPGRLPGAAVFVAGMLAGALTVALASWLQRRGRATEDGRPPAAADPAAADPAGIRALQVRPLRAVTPLASPVAAESQARQVPSLRIGVLGSLTINGQAGALVPAQSQLIVALALHRDGLPNKKLRTLLGADSDHPKPADSLRQLIARTRRALGRSADGKEWIEHLGHGQYALHPDARVDWLEFETLTTEGIRSAGAGPLAEALNMIRGQPFTGCYYWWLEPDLVDSVTARIVAAAETLAELRLADARSGRGGPGGQDRPCRGRVGRAAVADHDASRARGGQSRRSARGLGPLPGRGLGSRCRRSAGLGHLSGLCRAASPLTRRREKPPTRLGGSSHRFPGSSPPDR